MPGVIAGADVGGSKADVAIVLPDQPMLRRTVPTAEWYRRALPGVAAGLAETLRDLAGGVAIDVFVVGAHGCDDRDQGARLAADIADQVGISTYVVNDAELVLPAADVSSGIGLIIGTGSIAVGYGAQDAVVAVGGWGGYLGDEGSGTGLFRDAARAVTRAWDRGQRDDPLRAVLMDLLGLRDLRDLPARLTTELGPTAWSALTPPLFERALALGSPLAEAVIERSAAALAELIVVAGEQGADDRTVVATGGLINNAAWFRSALEAAFARECPQTDLRYLEIAPVHGALKLAEHAVRGDGASPLPVALRR